MISEAEIAPLRAEVVAIQAVMIAVFRRLVADRPELAPIFCQAFDEAESILTGVAVKIGLDVPAASTIGALQVIEEFRAAVIRDESQCS